VPGLRRAVRLARVLRLALRRRVARLGQRSML